MTARERMISAFRSALRLQWQPAEHQMWFLSTSELHAFKVTLRELLDMARKEEARREARRRELDTP